MKKIPQTILISCLVFSLLCCNGLGGGTNGASGIGQNSPALPVWTNSFSGIPFTMVGTDPMKPGAGTTNIPVIIIPVSFSFSLANTIISPQSTACGDTTSAINRVASSPMFTTNTWTDGQTVIGQTQFPDAFQRANFWSIVNNVSPNYHVMLQPVSMRSAIQVEVPLNSALQPNPNPACIQQPVGAVPIDFMNQVVQNAITNLNITPDTLPIFVTYNMAYLLPTGGFFLGYHNRAQGNQTFIVASYTDPGFISSGYNVADIAVLSHELGEWMDNPLLVNKVPAWGRFGIEPVCGNDLEVGDPLTDKVFTFQTPGFTYHIQELAFFSWFARNVPSLAINGRYSMRSTFATPAPPCF